MSPRRRWPVAAGLLVGLALTAAVPAPTAEPAPLPGWTEAAWSDPEYASGGQVTAGAMPKPTITECTTQTRVVLLVGIVFKSVTLTWTSERDTGDQRVAFAGKTANVTPTRTGPVGGVYTYSATYEEGLLSSLIGNLLGSTTRITVETQSGNWVSPAATKDLRVELLGMNPKCT